MPRYRQDRSTGELVEIRRASRAPSTAPAIVPDIEPFTSPIDGRTIGSRRDLRVHNEAHGVAEHREYGENHGAAFFESKQRERLQRLAGQTRQDRRERLEAIIPIVERHEK